MSAFITKGTPGAQRNLESSWTSAQGETSEVTEIAAGHEWFSLLVLQVLFADMRAL